MAGRPGLTQLCAIGFSITESVSTKSTGWMTTALGSVDVLVIPTNEEWMMAHHAQTLLAL